jgi:hypothetical protein
LLRELIRKSLVGDTKWQAIKKHFHAKQVAGSARKQAVGAISCLLSGKPKRVQILKRHKREWQPKVAIVTAMDTAAGG